MQYFIIKELQQLYLLGLLIHSKKINKNMITYLGLICLTHLFVVAEPSILIKRLLGFKEEEYDNMSLIKRFFYRMTTCHLCSGFWIGLFSGNILIAAIISVSAEILNKIINKI
jgi:hypothetical protein